MAYYSEQSGSDLPQNWEQYHESYGNKPGQPGWENLSDPERDWIKKGRAPYQSYTAEEEAIMSDIWGDISAGSPADIGGLESLMGRYKMSPGIRQYLIKRVGKLLSGGPGYQDVYKAQKGKLDVALREGERGIAETQAARGLSDSSGTQARLGALEAGYSGSLADLLMGTREMEERSRATRFGQGLGLAELGLGWQEGDIRNKTTLETLRNMLYTQDIGLKAGGLEFLAGERGRENMYNLGFAQLPQDEPLSGIEALGPIITGGMQAFLASQTGGASTLAGGNPFEDLFAQDQETYS